MKKIFLTVFVLMLPIIFAGCVLKEHPAERSINVYSWGEFISNGSEGSMNVNKKFTEETGIKVNYKTFQNNEELFAKVS